MIEPSHSMARQRAQVKKQQQQTSPSPPLDENKEKTGDDSVISEGQASSASASSSPSHSPSSGPRPAAAAAGKSERGPLGAAVEWLLLLVLVMYAGYLVNVYQSERLPEPLSPQRSGVRGFSEETALHHVNALVALGPHPVGSEPLLKALVYVYSQLVEIKDDADPFVDFEVDLFEPGPGVERLSGGLFKGKSLAYANLKHLVVRLGPGDYPQSKENAVLISSHIDSVITSPGAGDCSSCIATLIELIRALSHWASGFKHSIIFLLNTGEEEGLLGAHSFMEQHPWRSTVRAAIDVESMGIGGRSMLFQAGPNDFLLQLYASVAKYPAAQIVAQDVFHFGLVKSATDFQVYREVGGLSGLDFAWVENGGVYHTRNDKIENLRAGSLQHIGDDLLALLKAAAVSDGLEFLATNHSGSVKMQTVYFDILGKWFITYPLASSKVHQFSLICQGLVLLLGSLYLSGYTAFVEFGLALVTIVLTWVFSLAYVFIVAAVLPFIGASPSPYIANPWLVIGLFGAPAVFGALIGNALGRVLLTRYLRKEGRAEDHVQWLAERWLFKAGIFQWIVVLGLGTWVGAGSAHIALFWIAPPTFAYGALEAQFTPRQSLRGLLRSTLWLAMIPGVVISAVPVIRLTSVLVGNLVRFDRNPGSIPLWGGNVLTGILIAGYSCLMLIYLLPYAHRSGGLPWILGALSSIVIATLLLSQSLPAFTEDTGRAIQAVHVVDTKGHRSTDEDPRHYISILAFTAGKFETEKPYLNDQGFICGPVDTDFVTFQAKYGCVKQLDEDETLSAERPTLEIEKDKFLLGQRVTVLKFNSRYAYRWTMGINTTAIQSFKLKSVSKGEGDDRIVVPLGSVVGVDGWHTLQFIADQDWSSEYQLTLLWHSDSTETKGAVETLLLKVRTDVDRVTDELDPVLKNLPPWCVLFGKSTSPYPLTYLTDFKAPILS